MSFNNQNFIPSINKHTRFSGKENNHSLSPNIRPIQSSNKPIQNNLFPKNQIIFNNSNHFNIKVNKITRKKEQIIEGDLNFNKISKPVQFKNYQKNNFINHKGKRRGIPNKSPFPISGSFKPNDMLSFKRIFSSNMRQQEEKKFGKTNNMFRPSGNSNFMNNYIFGGNLNMNMSKSFNDKKNERSHSPLLRIGDNKILNLGRPNKNRIMSKSPNLGKSSNFNGSSNISIALLNNNGKKVMKKLPNNNTNNLKKLNNINPSQKRNTVISGEINQESLKFNRKNNNNIFANVNIRPISNNNTLNISSNNTNSLHNNYSKNNINAFKNNNNDNILKNNFLGLNNSNSHNNIRARPISPKNNPEKNKNHLNNKKNNINKNDAGANDNKKEKEKEKVNINIKNISKNEENTNICKEINNNQENNNKKMNNVKKEENKNNIEQLKNNQHNKSDDNQHKKNVRSHSQTPINPLKNEKSEDSSPNKLDNQKNVSNNKKPENPPIIKKVIKKIKDILPYTHVGFDGEEPKENNQDNYFIFRNFADHKDYIYMSVCDGHGVEGHFVSEFIKEVLPYYMSENLKDKNILTEKEITHQIISDTFEIVNNMLVSNENINSLFSGSTCVSVIFTPERLIVPNIGDSRAVLARFDKGTGKYKAIELSRDHKPTEKDEAKRIYDNDGRIQPFTEDGEFVGPQRVWIKEEEVPGLAMTRSFGDRVAATVGVMSRPEIKEFDFDENDKYMIIASDGIWEFISSQECIDIIQKYYESNDLKGCCEYLYQESSKRWLKEEEVIDDTTLILVFFE